MFIASIVRNYIFQGLKKVSEKEKFKVTHKKRLQNAGAFILQVVRKDFWLHKHENCQYECNGSIF